MDSQKIKETIKELMKQASFTAEGILIDFDPQNNEYWCAIETKEPHFLIGREGENLSAFSHLVRRIIERNFKEGEIHPNITVDVNGFYKKKNENLKALAHMMAERARFFKSSVEVDPMSAYDRRIIHEFLSDKIDLKTESVGEGRSRRVVIRYTGAI